jgi:hypothetical protein
MFNKNFYPTPKAVIDQMLDAANFNKWQDYEIVLEPSAGKGDILDRMVERYGEGRRWNTTPRFKMYAIEIEPELQAILRDKDYSIIADNFLECDIVHRPRIIIMNPPFDNGAKHLLRAWDILQPGGTIVCLLNAETLNNCHTRERKLLATVVEANGKIIEMGACFNDAQRTTNVDVHMVVLQKAGNSDDFFNFDRASFEKQENFAFDNNQNFSSSVEIMDKLLAREHRYLATINAFKELHTAIKNFNNCISPLVDYNNLGSKNGEDNFFDHARCGSFNGFIDLLNTASWNKLMKETNFERYMTSSVLEEFRKAFSHQKKYAFTKTNMLKMFDMLMQNGSSILDKNLLTVFDIMTKYHKDNRCHIEGWKTNDAFKVNMKVILPSYVRWGHYMTHHDRMKYGDKFSCHRYTELHDIDRAMCYISGKKFELLQGEKENPNNPVITTIYQAMERKFDKLGKVGGTSFDNTFESTFFRCKFFKKGTLHIEFKDELLWQIFNMKVSEMRGFPLPAGECEEIIKRQEIRGLLIG